MAETSTAGDPYCWRCGQWMYGYAHVCPPPSQRPTFQLQPPDYTQALDRIEALLERIARKLGA